MGNLPVIESLPHGLGVEHAFRRLATLPGCVFLDSALRDDVLGRYSFIAADPFEWHAIEPDHNLPVSRLRDLARTFPASTVPGLPPFQGGIAGVFGYSLGERWETIPRPKYDDFHLPQLVFGLYDVVLAFDHRDDRSWLISQGFPETSPLARNRRAVERARQFQSVLAIDPQRCATHVIDPLLPHQLAPQFPVIHEGGARFPHLTSNLTRDEYLATIDKAVEYIRAGDIFQVNLSQRLLHPAVDSAIELYCRLRSRNPAPFAGYFDAGTFQVVSASPERFLRLTGRDVETRPIKGTRGRVPHTETDLFLGDELQASGKDRAENVMIVDLLRNDLSRVCEPDSVRVSQLCGLEVFAHVQHLVSVVQGRLQSDKTAWELISGSFPGGSITGAPKIRAMEIIAELEPTARGFYCGSMGYLGFDGAVDLSILIRTVTAARGWWQFPVGGGIVAQSSPQHEFDETWHKASGILRALQS